MNKKIVGLTGGIASGKSAAAEMFESAGAYIIDADVVARAVADGAECKSALKEQFPEAFCEGVLNRGYLRELVFADGAKLRKLNAITHPLICKEIKRLADRAAFGVVMIVAPLLYESGLDKLASVVITVSCSESERIKRLTARDSINETLARKMISSQMSDAERENRADIVIRNGGSLAELRAQVIRIYCELTDKSGEVKPFPKP